MKINTPYKVGIFIILALPLLASPFLFSPPDWAKTISLRIVITVMIGLVAYQFFFKKNIFPLKELIKNKIVWLLAALFLVYFLAGIFSPDPYFSFWGSPTRAGGLVNFGFYIVFSLFVFLVASEGDYKKFWMVSIGTGIAVAAVALIQYYNLLGNILIPVAFRPTSTIGNSIFLGMYLLMLFFAALAYGIQEKSLPFKIFYLCSCTLFLYVIVLSGSRAAYGGLLIGALYFILLYPQKIKAAKIGLIVLLVITIGLVVYINTNSHVPQFLENNRIFQLAHSRLSVSFLLHDARFSTWAVAVKAFAARPLLGWGMENFSIGFNKYYTPFPGDAWWDKPHNIFLQIATEGGIGALIIYLILIGSLVWKLWNVRKKGDANSMTAHMLMTLVVSYLVSNFFSIDSYPTYILFFLLVAHALFLIQHYVPRPEAIKNPQIKILKYGKAYGVVLFLVLLFFLWQYNIKPLIINRSIVYAASISQTPDCENIFTAMDKAISSKSLLDSYARLRYVEFIKDCSQFHSERLVEFVTKGKTLLQQSVDIQPLYPRTYIFLGSFDTLLASQEPDPAKRGALVQEAYAYFTKADSLAPDRQETLYEKTKTDILARNFPLMLQEAETCIRLYPDTRECYQAAGLACIYLKDFPKATQYLQAAQQRNLNVYDFPTAYQIMDAYTAVGDVQELQVLYQRMQLSYGTCTSDSLPICYWKKAVVYIYQKEYAKASESIAMAQSRGFDTHSLSSLYQLISAYNAVGNFEALATIYEQLVATNPNAPQFHSSLAIVYRTLGKYDKARAQALELLRLIPEAKDEIDAFIKTLR